MVFKRKTRFYRGKLAFRLDFGIASGRIPNPCVACSRQDRGTSSRSMNANDLGDALRPSFAALVKYLVIARRIISPDDMDRTASIDGDVRLIGGS